MTYSKDALEVVESSVLNPHQESSLLNVAPLKVVPLIMRVKESLPEIAVASEEWLRKYIKPDERDERLRLSFWDEYNLVTAGTYKRRMRLDSILSGICNENTWSKCYANNDRKLLWILTPPKSYVQSMNYILHLGTERLSEIMSLPIKQEDGSVDHKAASLILKAFEMVDMRVKGGILQKMQVEQKNLNVHVSAPSDLEAIRGIDDISKLEALSSKLEIEAPKNADEEVGTIAPKADDVLL